MSWSLGHQSYMGRGLFLLLRLRECGNCSNSEGKYLGGKLVGRVGIQAVLLLKAVLFCDGQSANFILGPSTSNRQTQISFHQRA